MMQGYSGSTVRRRGSLVEKTSSDRGFMDSPERQRDLIALSHRLDILPWIERIDHSSIVMEFVEGCEGITVQNAQRAGKALQLLHSQQDYRHPCFTGLSWLVELANEFLEHRNYPQSISVDIINEFPDDALIHSEPVQFIEKEDGSIVWIDFEGIGMGSRYQDLGFIYYRALLEDQPGLFTAFIQGYRVGSDTVDMQRVEQFAGIISLAYARFADAEKRYQLGLGLLKTHL